MFYSDSSYLFSILFYNFKQINNTEWVQKGPKIKRLGKKNLAPARIQHSRSIKGTVKVVTK